MEPSILKSTKKVLHIGLDDNSFDLDVIIHINSAFSTLNDMGVGPTLGFGIEDDTAVWEDFLPGEGNKVQRNRVKTFILLTTRLGFDPPSSGFLLNAAQKQLDEVTWRLSVKREESEWANPNPSDTLIIDGGDPSGGV